MRQVRLALVLSATLLPAAALADDYDEQPSPAPSQTAQPQPTTPTTTPTPTPVVVTPANPTPPPVVIVNPQPQVIEHATPDRTVTETETVRDAWNAPVFTSGALVFLGSYGASVITAASSSHQGADRLYVPVVGPWLALNEWGHCPITNINCDSTTTAKVLLVADGIFQAAGVLTMIDGLLEPSHHRVYTRTAHTIDVAPTGNGFAVLGSF